MWGRETEEFLRQSDDYADQYRTVHRVMQRYNIAEDDHFDELERLVSAVSEFFSRVMALLWVDFRGVAMAMENL